MSGKVTCPQAVSRESHRTRNKNNNKHLHKSSLDSAFTRSSPTRTSSPTDKRAVYEKYVIHELVAEHHVHTQGLTSCAHSSHNNFQTGPT
jgi:hypothetical protein